MRQFRFTPALPETQRSRLVMGLSSLHCRVALHGYTPALHVPPLSPVRYFSLASGIAWYALLSIGRMAAAYVLSMLFSLFYVTRQHAIELLEPCSCLARCLTECPIFHFCPSFTQPKRILPQAVAAELAAIVLIFTSQAWNMTFSFINP
jgi:NitT/TauT family transport system permease protein